MRVNECLLKQMRKYTGVQQYWYTATPVVPHFGMTYKTKKNEHDMQSTSLRDILFVCSGTAGLELGEQGTAEQGMMIQAAAAAQGCDTVNTRGGSSKRLRTSRYENVEHIGSDQEKYIKYKYEYVLRSYSSWLTFPN